MRAGLLAAAVLAWGMPAHAADTVACADVEALSGNLNPIMRAFTDMAKWCADMGKSDPACLRMGEIMREYAVPERASAVSMWMVNITVQCTNPASQAE